MSDLRAREAAGGDWDGPVVELVEDEQVVAIVYLDDDVLFAEFQLDSDGDAWAFEVGDLQLALDTARAMLLPEGTEALQDPAASDSRHPVDRLAEAFDERAARRGDEDEGFYPADVAGGIIRSCEALGLAVVAIEGFRMLAGEPSAVSGMSVDTGDAHDGEAWPTFLAGCNVQAMGLLERWAREPGLLVALEVGDSSGERYVL